MFDFVFNRIKVSGRNSDVRDFFTNEFSSSSLLGEMLIAENIDPNSFPNFSLNGTAYGVANFGSGVMTPFSLIARAAKNHPAVTVSIASASSDLAMVYVFSGPSLIIALNGAESISVKRLLKEDHDTSDVIHDKRDGVLGRLLIMTNDFHMSAMAKALSKPKPVASRMSAP